MTIRERFTQIIERQTLKALARRNPSLKPLLSNDALLDSVILELKEAHASEATAHAADPKGGPFQDFLTWLITNGPQLVAFITALITLFGQKSAENPTQNASIIG